MTEDSVRDWGMSALGVKQNPGTGLLADVVKKLSPKAKQAMFAAAEHGLIKRGTWNGCAFNMAGALVAEKLSNISDEREYVKSTYQAALVFDMPHTDVDRFIICWDGLKGTDEECTQMLKDAIQEVGLFAPANERKGKRIVRQTLYKSEETRLMEAFQKQLDDFSVPATSEAAELLCMAR